MQSITWPGQRHRDHIVDYEEDLYLTGWRLGCPNCGEMIAASASQNIHEVHDLHAGGRVYAQLTTVCMHCQYPLTEIFTIN